MKPWAKRIHAFSLVEVALAMAVISFCLVVLLGLFSTAMVDSKKASDDTNLAAMAWMAASDLRSQTTANMAGVTNNIFGLGSVASSYYYFDANGQMVTNTATAPNPVYYSCHVAVTNTLAAVSAPNLQEVLMQFTYPPGGKLLSTQNFYVTIPPP